MVAYAQRSDLYLYGLPNGAVVQVELVASAVDPVADSVTVAGHGLETASPLAVRSAVPGYPLPTPLVNAQTVYVIRVDDSTVQLATTSANATTGIAIDLTDAGSANALLLCPSMDVVVAAALELASRQVDARLSLDLPLVAPYPLEVVAITARIAAADLLARNGQQNDAASKLYEIAMASLERYASGVPFRDAGASLSAFNQSARGASGCNIDRSRIP